MLPLMLLRYSYYRRTQACLRTLDLLGATTTLHAAAVIHATAVIHAAAATHTTAALRHACVCWVCAIASRRYSYAATVIHAATHAAAVLILARNACVSASVELGPPLLSMVPLSFIHYPCYRCSPFALRCLRMLDLQYH